jgi:hypothetical protein
VKKISARWTKTSLSLLASAADAHGQSLSSWLNEAATNQLRIEQGLAHPSASGKKSTVSSPKRARAYDRAVLEKPLVRPSRRSA